MVKAWEKVVLTNLGQIYRLLAEPLRVQRKALPVQGYGYGLLTYHNITEHLNLVSTRWIPHLSCKLVVKLFLRRRGCYGMLVIE